MVLLHAGHKYNFVKTNMCGTTNWRCVNKNICSTSITLTADNKEIVKEAKHVCLPDYERNKIDFTMSLAKQEVCLNMAPIPEIFEKHYYKLHKLDSDHTFGQGEMLSPEELPTFSSKKDTLYRARYKFLNVKKSKFLRPQDVQLPDSLVSDFFLYDDGVEEKIIIFGTRLAKATLKTVDIVYVDGTFRCCPIPFYQLFSVHADITHESGTVCFVPLLFALLPNKSQTTYERLFKILKYQFFMNISTFKCDYELAIIQAIKAIYPDIVVKGCYYHFTNAVWKKSKSINFSSSNEGRKCTQLFSLLALLPASLIPEAYLTLCELAPNTEESTQFQNYFSKQWINLITREVFSCFGEKFRTTNAIEGWHKRINSRIPKRPSMLYFIMLLKKEAKLSDIKIVRGSFYCAGKRRRKSDILVDRKIEQIVSECVRSEISVFECLQRLAILRRFDDDN